MFAWAEAAGNFSIVTYGAKADGVTLNSGFIQKAIDAAAAAGGGTVIVPPGRFLTGSFALRSSVTLHLQKGAVLLGSTNRMHYRKINFHGLILAHNQRNIAITGEGIIDGQGVELDQNTRKLHKEGKLPSDNEAERPTIIHFRKCDQVHVRQVTLLQSACWVQLYRECTNVLIENIKVRSCAAITNDGIDIDSCSNVVIRGCDIDSEDDGICLKSGPRPCENVLIEHCRVRSSCNAFKLGTASNKGFRNIVCRHLEIYDTYLSGIALEMVDGGILENISISHVRMKTTNNPLFIRLGHRNAPGPVGTLQQVTISDVVAEIPNRRRSEMNRFPSYWRHLCTTLITGSITGLPGHPVRGITLRNIDITYGGIGDQSLPGHQLLENLTKIPECAKNYPESKMFGVLPAWGLYCRHVEDLTMEHVRFRVSGKDYRTALLFDDVKTLRLQDCEVASVGREPLVVLHDVHDARLRHIKAPTASLRAVDQRGKNADVHIKP
ncbi:MAG: hypothetical protein RLZZ224_1568 [Verrucomicrobiota bacterium]